MQTSVFEAVRYALLRYLPRVYSRWHGCGAEQAQAAAQELFRRTLSVPPAEPDTDTAAICDLSAVLAAPKNMAGRFGDDFGEISGQPAPLYSVFERLWPTSGLTVPKRILLYDTEKKTFSSASASQSTGVDYRRKWQDITAWLEKHGSYANNRQLLEMLREYAADIPLAADNTLLCDLSLYEHARLSAAFSGALTAFQHCCGEMPTAALKETEALLLYSADFSGIQNFIYTITADNALKTLRAKSFFIELVMQMLTDEITEAFGLDGVSVLYSGGGHCYILLPALPDSSERLQKIHANLNRWAIRSFGSGLCVVWDTQPCTPNAFLNEPVGSYAAIFQNLTAKLAVRKLQRYSAEELILLNRPVPQKDGRECSVCGTPSDTVTPQNSKCPWCRFFTELSSAIMTDTVFPVLLKTRLDDRCLPVFSYQGEAYLTLLNEKEVIAQLTADNIKHIYCKNTVSSDFIESCPQRISIMVCDYQNSNLLEQLGKSAEGIERLGVLRMDVDNLGSTFISGFGQDISIARTAALSTQLSVFFKRRLAELLKETNSQVTVLYAGGDDVFLVGAWNDVIAASLQIHEELDSLTGGRLKVSAGIGICKSKYPVIRFAADTEALEKCSKQQDGKNAVTLFSDDGRHTYPWHIYRDKVQGEKLRLLNDFIHSPDNAKGMSFIYNLLETIRGCRQDRIYLARAAYFLARMCEDKSLIDKKNARTFSSKVYDWIMKAEDRRHLETAISIFVYYERKGQK